eukprot:1781388-Prymnesium_polylepis.1
MAQRSAPRQAAPCSSAPDSRVRAAHAHQHTTAHLHVTHAKSAHAQCSAAHITQPVRTQHSPNHYTCAQVAPARATTRRTR